MLESLANIKKMKEYDRMKTTRVVAAVICDSFDKTQKIFATTKGYGDFKGKWNFPPEAS